MDIPAEVLVKIRCDQCKEYLPSGPVFLQNDEECVCSKCFTPVVPVTNEEAQQDDEEIEYEEIEYKEEIEYVDIKVKYSNEDVDCTSENSSGKETIETLSCPLKQVGSCEWNGERNKLLQHCRLRHPGKVVRSPCYLMHSISKDSQKKFLLVSFKNLFLLQTKVCLTTKKIYHCIQYLGDPKMAPNFAYSVDIRRSKLNISIPGKVICENSQPLQKSTSALIDIDSLVTVLQGYEGTIFNIIMQNKIDGTEERDIENVLGVRKSVDNNKVVRKNVKETSNTSTTSGEGSTESEVGKNPGKIIKYPVIEDSDEEDVDENVAGDPTKCVRKKCGCPLKKHIYRDDKGWYCEHCAPKFVECINKPLGCTFSDIQLKTRKHKIYYCSYNKTCNTCYKVLNNTPMAEHYEKEHSKRLSDKLTHKYDIGKLMKVDSSVRSCILCCNIGNIILEHWIFNNVLTVRISSSIKSRELYGYNCYVKLTDLRTKQTIAKTMNHIYHFTHDWATDIDCSELPPKCRELFFKIEITKIDRV